MLTSGELQHDGDDEQMVTVECINFSECDSSLPLLKMLKLQLTTIKPKKPRESIGSLMIGFYKYRSPKLSTHKNYEIQSHGDWDMGIYKCSTKSMSIFYFCKTFFRTNYYDSSLKRFPSITLMEIMDQLRIYFIRTIRKKGNGEVLDNQLHYSVKFESFDGLPKHYVKAVFINHDGNFKRLVCESEGFIYCFDYCTS